MASTAAPADLNTADIDEDLRAFDPTEATRFRRLKKRVSGAILRIGGPFTKAPIAFAALGLYFLGMLGLQLLLQSGGRNEDAALFLHAQSLRTVYDPLNPPLAAWLAWGLEQIFGPSLLAVRLTVLLPLALFYGALYGLARQITEDRQMAVAGALAPAFMFQIAWYSFISLSHSTMFLLMAACLGWVLTALVRKASATRFLLLGVVLGLGLLAKYNFALLALAAVLVLITTEAGRARLSDPRLLLSGLVTLILILPHAMTVLIYNTALIGEITSVFAAKLGTGEDTAHIVRAGSGLAELGEHGLMVLLPAALGLLWFLPAFSAARQPLSEAQTMEIRDLLPDQARLTALLLPLVTLGLMAMATLVFGISRFGAHHLLFLALLFPALFAILAERGPWPVASAGFMLLPLLGCVIIPIALSHFVLKTAADCDTKCGPVFDYAGLAQDLTTSGATGQGEVVVLSHPSDLPLVQLRPWMPEARFTRLADPMARHMLPTDRAPAAEDEHSDECLVLWSERRDPNTRDRLFQSGIPEAGLPPFPATAETGTIARPLLWGDRLGPPVGWMRTDTAHGPCGYGVFEPN